LFRQSTLSATSSQGQHAEVVAAFGENIEGTELHFMIVLAPVQRLKSETPSTPSTTASPSSTKLFWRTLRAASTIHG
jgi:hypothetical protein